MFDVRYDSENEHWEASHNTNDDFKATTVANSYSLLLGTHEWIIQDDTKSCQTGKGPYMASLTLTACNDTQYTCFLEKSFYTLQFVYGD